MFKIRAICWFFDNNVNFDDVFVLISERIVKFDLDQNILFKYKIRDNDNTNNYFGKCNEGL